MKPTPASHATAAGFTLIEVIVVVVIMSVLAGVALLSMNRVDPASAGGCGDRLRTWLTGIEARAMQEDVILYLGLDGSRAMAARLEPEEDEDSDETIWRMQPVEELDLPGNCRLQAPADTEPALPTLEGYRLAVTPAGGWSSPGGLARIEVTGADGKTRHLVLGEEDQDAD